MNSQSKTLISDFEPIPFSLTLKGIVGPRKKRKLAQIPAESKFSKNTQKKGDSYKPQEIIS